MLVEFLKFIIYSGLIVLISKYILVTTLRNLAQELELKTKTVGNIAGIATSIPELLTVTISSVSGFFSATIFNILSSNVINFIQYIVAVISNKNIKSIKNKAIVINIVLVIVTIIIPLLTIFLKIEMKLTIVPIFLILYFIFIYINNKIHKKYLKKEDEKLEQQFEENKIEKKKTILYVFIIIIIGISLYFIGELLGNVLNNLANIFNISEMIIGILLGFVTSIPELITFTESQRHHKKEENNMLGIVEATNNLFTSNVLNLFIIQSIGIIIYQLNF